MVVGAVLVVVLGQAVPAGAQFELQQWVEPTLGKMMGRGDYRLQYYSTEPVDGQNTNLNVDQHNFTLVTPLFQSSRDEWSLSGRLRYQDYETRAVLPDTAERFPNELYDVRGGLGYRHKFENDWILGGSFTFGSASDEPFHSEDELVLRAAGLLRVPRGERDAWIFTLIYASDEQILGMRHVPFPGVAYLWKPSDQLTAVIGVPFTSLEYKPTEKLTLEATYVPVRTFHAKAMYAVFRPLRVFLGFDSDHDAYYRAARGDKDDQLFYYEKRGTVGMRFDLRHVGIELTGSYVWDRFYFEGESFSDRHDNRIDVADGTVVGIRLSTRW
ncbi:MAG: hypothetical protein HYU41_08815 [Candidatus Rokubacteria bacterium]|nr:hypothetical protein [Candidatus Rokubacteria bacterium]